ncbi:I78 family peptidase inhibitor [uncultured Sphingomonas sp.]|uniref:I78 family peptidase inhibitor n=1 Tax=uncultured Sphingomonas sp. TaxID=158754 RepID=UPI0025E7E3E0|nr:I78 family peptidase inhibitor [uncultured Sphingomonas sp.]
MIRFIPIVLLAVAACTQTPAPATADPASGAQCDATPVQNLIGQPDDPATVDRAKAASGARTVRRYETGSALTMDFRPDRLNVEVDAGGKIVKLSCG